MSSRKPRPVRADQFRSYLEESQGLERDYIGELLRSRKWAWRVAAGCGLIAVLGVSAGIAGFLQPAIPPLVLRVDNATGAVERVSLMQEQETSYGEVVDEYWLNQYVLNRENYDYNTIQLNYDTTALLSAPPIQQEYYKLFEGAAARDQVLSNTARIVVHVRSIQPNGKGQATVRFSTQQLNSNGTKAPQQHQIATIGYVYVTGPMRASDRRINPLGFQVTSYRVDPETLAGR